MKDAFDHNEYVDLPEDPEVAFTLIQRRKYAEMLEARDEDSWSAERRYVDHLLAFDEVYSLGILTNFKEPPWPDNDFSKFFQDFERQVEIATQKFLIESARRLQRGAEQIVLLDAPIREVIHKLISSIRKKLNEVELPEKKREVLFDKLNAFASEVDRNRTRTEAFYAFAVETARAGREVNAELKPLQEKIDRISEWIEKGKKLRDALPPWTERRKITGQPKQLPRPTEKLFDDDIPF
ncbi:MAG: hypothetical protein AAGB11_10210 [Pseudomonadota bacterium]